MAYFSTTFIFLKNEKWFWFPFQFSLKMSISSSRIFTRVKQLFVARLVFRRQQLVPCSIYAVLGKRRNGSKCRA